MVERTKVGRHRVCCYTGTLTFVALSYLQVSKLDCSADSTWSLLARVSPSILQASLASVKFICGFTFLPTRATPMILHVEMERSAKKS